jgi:hypothetical protein
VVFTGVDTKVRRSVLGASIDSSTATKSTLMLVTERLLFWMCMVQVVRFCVGFLEEPVFPLFGFSFFFCCFIRARQFGLRYTDLVCACRNTERSAFQHS